MVIARARVVGGDIVGSAVVAAVVVALALRTRLAAADVLGLAAAVAVWVTTVSRRWLRLTLQGVVVAGVVALLARDVPTGAATAVWVVAVVGPSLLVAAVAVLATAFAGALDRARRRAAEVRGRADRRAVLVDVARRLVEVAPDRAPDEVVDAVRELGFDGAALGWVEGDRVVPAQVSGIRWAEALDAERGHVGSALRTAAPQVVADHRRRPVLGADRMLRALVIVPVRCTARPHGVLLVGRRRSAPVGADDLDVLAVLATHLAAAVDADRSVATQAALLDRLRDLEVLRGDIVGRVSTDLRRPLVDLESSTRDLADRAGDVAPEERRRTLATVRREATTLEATIEALLDVSRRRRRDDPAVGS